MISVKGYGIGNDISFVRKAISEDMDKAVQEVLTAGFGLCPEKDTVVDALKKALEEQEKETGNKVEGLFPVEVEITFTPKIKVKKVEYAEDKTDDN